MKTIPKVVFFLLFVVKARAQDEMFIDATFGNDGHTYIELAGNNHPNSSICDAEGNIFISGYNDFPGTILLAKLTPDGERDSTFANDGLFVYTSDTCYQAFSAKVNILPNGKLIVAATITHGATMSSSQVYLVILRINQDGTLDESFGNSGIFELQGSFFRVNDILISENGVTYFSCSLFSDANDVTRSRVYKLNDFDSLEEFGSETISFINPESTLIISRMVSVNGDILCVHIGGILFKLDSDGQLITSFGTDGYLQLPTYGYVSDISILESGQILALQAGLPSKLIRINQDGTLDEDFGFNGEFVLTNSEDCCRYLRLNEYPTGGLIVEGHSDIDCDGYFAQSRTHFAQLNEEGEQVLMSTSDGSVDISWGSYYTGVFTIQPNGKIIFSGSHLGSPETQLDFHTMRIDPSSVLSVSTLHSNNVGFIHVSPNPAQSVVYFKVETKSGYLPPMNSEMSVIDIQGREVMRQEVLLFLESDTIIELDVSKLHGGVYTVQGLSGGTWFDSVKLIKE